MTTIGSARKLAALAAVALFLIAAETYAAWHRADLETHATDGLCKICLTISAFSDGNVGHGDIPLLLPISQSCNLPYTATWVVRPGVPQKARGPPIAS